MIKLTFSLTLLGSAGETLALAVSPMQQVRDFHFARQRLLPFEQAGLIENLLTSLDIGGMHSLTEVYCSYDRLTQLSLTGLPMLTKLHFSCNNLTSIDLSNVPTRTTFDGYDNDMTQAIPQPATTCLRIDVKRNCLSSPAAVVNGQGISWLICGQWAQFSRSGFGSGTE